MQQTAVRERIGRDVVAPHVPEQIYCFLEIPTVLRAHVEQTIVHVTTGAAGLAPIAVALKFFPQPKREVEENTPPRFGCGKNFPLLFGRNNRVRGGWRTTRTHVDTW